MMRPLMLLSGLVAWVARIRKRMPALQLGPWATVRNATRTIGEAGFPMSGQPASPPIPYPPPLPMTEGRAKFIAAFLGQAFSGRMVTASRNVDGHQRTSHFGRIGVVNVFQTGNKWSVKFNLAGRVWLLGNRVGIRIRWGEGRPELWSETTTDAGIGVHDTFAPEGEYLGSEDRDNWVVAKRTLWGWTTGDGWNQP